jgi:ATP-dependent Clp protease ATP-binding subunit ClpC
MFEEYTPAARKAIFFARSEASQFGSSYIQAEHLLLGILREDTPLAIRLLGTAEKVNSMRQRIEESIPPAKEKLATSADLPSATRASMPWPTAQRKQSAWAKHTSGPNICWSA